MLARVLGSFSTLGSTRRGGFARVSFEVMCNVHLLTKWSDRHIPVKLDMSMCASACMSSRLYGRCMLSMRVLMLSLHLVNMRCLPYVRLVISYSPFEARWENIE